MVFAPRHGAERVVWFGSELARRWCSAARVKHPSGSAFCPGHTMAVADPDGQAPAAEVAVGDFRDHGLDAHAIPCGNICQHRGRGCAQDSRL